MEIPKLETLLSAAIWLYFIFSSWFIFKKRKLLAKERRLFLLNTLGLWLCVIDIFLKANLGQVSTYFDSCVYISLFSVQILFMVDQLPL
jgi:hypothetical protein